MEIVIDDYLKIQQQQKHIAYKLYIDKSCFDYLSLGPGLIPSVSLLLRLTPSCSSDSCSLQRTLGFGLLGAAGGLTLWETLRNRGRRGIQEPAVTLRNRRRRGDQEPEPQNQSISEVRGGRGNLRRRNFYN